MKAGIALVVGALAVGVANQVAASVDAMRTVRVVRPVLEDNGDDDGWADTRETVRMHLTVLNGAPVDLYGVVARLESDDPGICVTEAVVPIGTLLAGEQRTTEHAFAFVVGDVERTSVDQDLSTTFRVSFSADEYASLPGEVEVVLDLDLDATGGAGPTTFFEGFEAANGAFVPMDLDADLNPPDDDLDNHSAGLANSDGYRCQRVDPDWERSATWGTNRAATCYAGPTGSPDAFHWSVNGSRAFSGQQSLYYGVDLGQGIFTVPFAQLEAMRTSSPINIEWSRVCSGTANQRCSDDLECPGTETCVLATPELSLVHQVRLHEFRPTLFNGRAVVMAQEADAAGDPVGPWFKLEPFYNPYSDGLQYNYIGACKFDPIDDGNDEDDFFDPGSPSRIDGPSSTCYPELFFGRQGETLLPFDPGNVGYAIDGAGLEGDMGLGTWVEARIDLSRWRGRRIRLRFLATDVKYGGFVNYFDFYGGNTAEGWWIDDVRVTHTLAEPGALQPDTKDNTNLPGPEDSDGDGAICPDNCPAVSNPDQADGDGDHDGDVCDTCPSDPLNDFDQDGWCCDDDNCCSQSNPDQQDADQDGYGDVCDNCRQIGNDDQADRDGDGRGDVCDECPDGFDVGDNDGDGTDDACDNCLNLVNLDQRDRDGDEVGDLCDNCATRYNANQQATVLASSGLPVLRSAASPDGRWVVSTELGRVFSTSLAGETVVLAELPPDAAAFSIQITADSSMVVYSLDVDPGSALVVEGLYSVPIDGTAGPVRLSGNTTPRTDFALSPDGSRVVFSAWGDLVDLYSVPLTGGIPKLLGSHPRPPTIRISPDSSTVVYEPDSDSCSCDDQYDDMLYSVPIDGDPTQSVRLNVDLVPVDEDVAEFAISPDSTTVLYTIENSAAATRRLYRVPIGGGSSVPQHHGWVSWVGFNGDGLRLLYLAYEASTNRLDLFSAPANGGPSIRLNPPDMPRVRSWLSTASGDTIVFVLETGTSSAEWELRAVPATGGLVVPLDSGIGFGQFAVTPDDSQVVFVSDLDGTGQQVLGVAPLNGAEGQRLSHTLDAGERVFDFTIDPDGSHVAYRSGQQREDLFVVALDGSGLVRVNGLLPEAVQRVEEYGFGVNEDELYYIGRERSIEGQLAEELFLVALDDADEDDDGTLAFCDCDDADPATRPNAPERNDGRDNQCPGDPGHGQIDEITNLRFTNAATLTWSPQQGATDYEVLRAAEPTLPACTIQSTDEPSWMDGEPPSAGRVFFYVARANAPFAGTWGQDGEGNLRLPPCLASR